MGSLQLIALFIGVAIIAGACGYAGSIVGRRNPRRVFVLGFLCGSVTGSVLRGRRRRLANRTLRRVLPGSRGSDPRRRSRPRPQKVRVAVR